MVFPRSISDSKSLQDSGTLLSILADLTDAVVLLVFTCSFISGSSSHFTNPFGIVPSAPFAIGITVTLMFHSFFFCFFFTSLARFSPLLYHYY